MEVSAYAHLKDVGWYNEEKEREREKQRKRASAKKKSRYAPCRCDAEKALELSPLLLCFVDSTTGSSAAAKKPSENSATEPSLRMWLRAQYTIRHSARTRARMCGYVFPREKTFCKHFRALRARGREGAKGTGREGEEGGVG